jgi:hypothetical protein
MGERFVELPFLRNVGLMMTLRCQVTCPHCIVQAGPHRKEEMLVADACDWLRQIAAYRNGSIKIVALTGGEPFYNVAHLRTVSDYAAGLGLLSSAVTNAFWAATPERALHTLREVPNVRVLSISTDVYHQVAIPLEWVRNAVGAAEACHVAYSISVCTENENDEGYRAILGRLQEFTSKEYILTAIVMPVGRALERLGRAGHELTTDLPISACATGSSPVIFPDGKVIGCIGPVIDLAPPHPLVLGNLRQSTLAEILDRAQTNAILHALRAWGPRKLIPMIQEAGLGRHLPAEYIKDSVCDACYHLMACPPIVEYLTRLAEDHDFQRLVAYARAYYLNEPEMVQALKLIGALVPADA